MHFHHLRFLQLNRLARIAIPRVSRTLSAQTCIERTPLLGMDAPSSSDARFEPLECSGSPPTDTEHFLEILFDLRSEFIHLELILVWREWEPPLRRGMDHSVVSQDTIEVERLSWPSVETR